MRDRTNPRHSGFDYRTFAAYFVTICTHERRHLFGAVRRGRMTLNGYGEIVGEEWKRSEEIRDEVVLDAFVVMPNHMHGIVCLVPPDVDDVSPRGYDLDVGSNPARAKTTSDDDVGTTGGSSLHQREEEPTRRRESPNGPSAKSLSAMVGGFKAAVTKRMNKHRRTPGTSVWQSRYHDRILRNEQEWRACRTYIERNPGQWAEDRHHP
jgi:putative transposase